VANPTGTPQTLKEAHHRGWLAGVALRLGHGVPGRNPYDRDAVEHLEWDIGFDEGFNDGFEEAG